jgi:hypothetical protein
LHTLLARRFGIARASHLGARTKVMMMPLTSSSRVGAIRSMMSWLEGKGIMQCRGEKAEEETNTSNFVPASALILAEKLGLPKGQTKRGVKFRLQSSQPATRRPLSLSLSLAIIIVKGEHIGISLQLSRNDMAQCLFSRSMAFPALSGG